MRNLQCLPALWQKRSLTVSASQKTRGIPENSETSKRLSEVDPLKLTQCCTLGNFRRKRDWYKWKRKKCKHCLLHLTNVLSPVTKIFWKVSLGPKELIHPHLAEQQALRVEIIMVQKLCCPADSSTVPCRHGVLVLLLCHFSLHELLFFFYWGKILLKANFRDLKEAVSQHNVRFTSCRKTRLGLCTSLASRKHSGQ